MKTTKLKTAVNNKFIFKLKDLSYHTKCILSKITVDFVQSNNSLDFEYMLENIFGVWPEDIVWKAIDELADCDVMFIDFNDTDDEQDSEEEDCECEMLLFNPKFIEKACPYLNCCPCCNPSPTNFNVIYN